jgi:tRNA 5-methylaminomethyl-2-thiouridine biosynthesis bifunctional protein
MPADADQIPFGVSSALLEWTEAGEPRSSRFNDVYFSRDDGLAETRKVFLEGCGLAEAWKGRDVFVIAELGLGTGLNVLAAIELWRRTGPLEGWLHIFSVEAYPMHAAEAARALASWPELADIASLFFERWPQWTPGNHRISLPEFRVTLDVTVGDAGRALEQWEGLADAWFLDGFSPALNPEMWSQTVLDGIAAKSAPGARLATFTVAGFVRRGLSERGFVVEKRPGHGRKRERLQAQREQGLDAPTLAVPNPRHRTVAIIGAGIAGASVARALTAAGQQVHVLDQDHAGSGASGFPAALVTPRLDAGDSLIAGFHAQALRRAADLYQAIEGAVTASGVVQLEQMDRDAARYARISKQPFWGHGDMHPLSPDATAALTGEPHATGGLNMLGALAIRPAIVLQAFLAGARVQKGQVSRIEPCGSGWRTLDCEGNILSESDELVLTAGWGLANLQPALALRPVRGQADWVEDVHFTPAIAWGGYVVPMGQGVLYGATHSRDETSTEVRHQDSARNLETLAARLPALASLMETRPVKARAAIRATTGDRLPVCGPVPDQPGLSVLGGLGSRGFCVAPLLGEHLAARLMERPSPLPRDYALRLDCARFRS